MIVNPDDIQDENKVEEWKSCCLKADKNAVKYFIQVGILSGLILFSATMLVVDRDCNYFALHYLLDLQ